MRPCGGAAPGPPYQEQAGRAEILPKVVDREREEGGVSFRVINVRRRLAGR